MSHINCLYGEYTQERKIKPPIMYCQLGQDVLILLKLKINNKSSQFFSLTGNLKA